MISPTLDASLKKEQLPVGWPWRFLMFSVLVATIAAVVSAGLTYGYIPFLKSRIAAQDESLGELSRIIPKDQQEKFIAFYSQLAHLRGILKGHAVASPLFAFLEQNTNARVEYTALDARVAEHALTLEGAAPNYAVFAEQLEAFKRAKETERVLVNDSNALQGIVRFRITVVLNPLLFTTP